MTDNLLQTLKPVLERLTAQYTNFQLPYEICLWMQNRISFLPAITEQKK